MVPGSQVKCQAVSCRSIALWVAEFSLCYYTCFLVSLGASSLSSVETLVYKAMPTALERHPLERVTSFFCVCCGVHSELGMRTTVPRNTFQPPYSLPWAQFLGQGVPALILHLLIY